MSVAGNNIKAAVERGDIAEAARLQYGYTVGSVLSRLAWGTMTYGHGENSVQAAGRTDCTFQRKVWLGLGVEGPPPLRDAELEEYIPAPFVAGRCPECGQGLQHVRWSEDENWWPEVRLVPDDVAVFAVPGPVTSVQNAERGYAGAQLLEPGERG